MNCRLDELVACFKEYLKLYSLEDNAVIKQHLKLIILQYISAIKTLLDTTFEVAEDEKKDFWSK